MLSNILPLIEKYAPAKVPKYAPAIKAQRELMRRAVGAEEALAAYDEIKSYWSSEIISLPPMVAKMGLGRGLSRDHFIDRFEGQNLRVWGCAIARFMMLKRRPDIAFAFYLLHNFGPDCEFSHNDNIWAVERGIKGDPLFGNDGTLEGLYCAIHDQTPRRLLSLANEYTLALMRSAVTGANPPRGYTRGLAGLAEVGWIKWIEVVMRQRHELTLPQPLHSAIERANGRTLLRLLELTSSTNLIPDHEVYE